VGSTIDGSAFKMKKSLGAKTWAVPTPAWLVGTYDADGKPNIMTIAWGGICGSNPPSLTVSIRPARHTFQAILDRKAFTVSIPSVDQVRETDYAGIAAGASVDKFAVVGWTPVRAEHVDAPYVAEAPMVVECRLTHTLELGVHTMMIGEIVDVKADEAVLDAEGFPDILKVRPIAYDPARGRYHGVGPAIAKGHSVGRELIK